MTCCCCYNALESLESIPEIFLCLQQCLMRLDISKNNLKHWWSSYAITLHTGPKSWLKGIGIPLLSHKKKYNGKHSVPLIPPLHSTIGRFALP